MNGSRACYALALASQLFCAADFTGLAFAQAAAVPQRGGTAIFTLSQDPTTVNPDVSTNPPDRQVGCIVYQGLVQLSPDYKVLPLLARAWDVSAEGLTYTFELNHAHWHDGQPFTSDDVKYTLLEVAAKYSSVFAPAGRAIESIDTPAPDKVIIRLKEPFGPFLISLGCIQGAAILPAHLFRGTDPLTNPATTTNPVGTGAFKLVEWQRGDHLRLARDPNYYEPGKPYLDEVIGKIITQSSTRLQALQAGEVDFTQYVETSALPALRADPNVVVLQSDSAPNTGLAFLNTQHKPLDDRRVRQALFMATDRDYLFRNAFFGVGQPGIAPFTTEIAWAADPAIDYAKMYPYDPARANALLDAAGVKRGADGKRFAVHMVTYATQYPEYQRVAIALKSMWQAIGVDVSIEALEDATFAKRIWTDGDFDVSFTSYTSYSDPALGIARAFVSSAIGRPFGNASRYSNPEVDALFADGQRATSFAERGVFYKKVQDILAQDLPILTLRQNHEVNAASKNLKDISGHFQGLGSWTEAWIVD